MKNPSAKEVKKILLALNRTVETFNKHFSLKILELIVNSA